MQKILMASLVAGAVVGIAPVYAQSYPTKPVTVIVPSSPGGISDTAARVIGEELSKMWKQQVIVENKPGGGGSIGVGAGSRAAKDGYTLLLTTNGEFALNPVIYPNLPYHPDKDFIPIVMATKNPMLLVANSSAPFNTYQEFLAAAKAKPGEVAWASPGAGTWNHFTGEWLQMETGIKLLHVPYKGGGPAGTAVAGGDVPTALIAISSSMPHIKAGRLKVLALTADQRSSLDPSWPTLSEMGLPGFDSASWVAYFAPTGTPAAIVKKIEADVITALQAAPVKTRFTALGIETVGMPSIQLAERIKADQAQAAKIAREANIKVE